MIIIPILLMLKIKNGLKELKNKDNLTLNILNVYFYYSMGICLVLQIITNLYIPIAEIIQLQKSSDLRKWLSFVFVGLFHYFRVSFQYMWFDLQVYEWVSILGILSWEKKVDWDRIRDRLQPSKLEKQKLNKWERKI